uniref:Uncharacterized protein n=1 Tax=Arundo donax TaxID=35708 RepID=A0A0A9GW98_ARUDO
MRVTNHSDLLSFLSPSDLSKSSISY